MGDGLPKGFWNRWRNAVSEGVHEHSFEVFESDDLGGEA